MLVIKNTLAIVCVYILFMCTSISVHATDSVTADFRIVSNLREVLPLTIDVTYDVESKERNDIECIAWNLYFEARGGVKLEQIAVAYVPINRTQHPKFSTDICTNVFQYNLINGKKSFQFVWAGYNISRSWKIEHDTWLRMQEIAFQVYQRSLHDPAQGSVYFSHKSINWAPSVPKIPLGSHVFWKM